MTTQYQHLGLERMLVSNLKQDDNLLDARMQGPPDALLACQARSP